MFFSQMKQKLLGILAKGPGDSVRRPDGGTSCYRPNRKKVHSPAGQPQTPMQAQQEAVNYIHTGFTDMNPPEAYAPVSENTYDSSRPFYAGNPAQMPSSRENAVQEPDYGYVKTGNISYMPGITPGTDGEQMCIRILSLTGLKSCYDAIENMKNGESLILTLDAIGNESEILRCQDMLAGAAFTLGCRIRPLQGSRMVLVTPEQVRVYPEEARQRPAAVAVPNMPPQEAPQVRVRRSVQNEGRWQESVRFDQTGNNPYTGRMPAAAGAYSNFGGFGI